jgi:L-threonylcarbamoyladenylate synthase
MDLKIQEAVALLRRGRVVAFPTETVYGLGADAGNPEAVRRIFAIKGRPADHPLIVHIGAASLMCEWARDVPPAAEKLAERFWPGPLTLILPRGRAPLEVTGGQDSVGLRMPDHPVALALLRAFGGGVAAPSANRFGRVSPTRAEHVREELGKAVDLILEGGDCRVGLESTILSLLGETPVLLRPGAIAPAALEAALGIPIATAAQDAGIRAPGLLEAHYAPDTRLVLCEPDRLDDRVRALCDRSLRVAVMTRTHSGASLPAGAHQHRMPVEPAAFGRQLYASLRVLDSADFDLIVVEQPPAEEAWRAVHDRLSRASHAKAGD